MMPWLDARISHSSPSLTGRKPLPVYSYKRFSHSRDLHYRQCLLVISSTGMSVTSSPISKLVAMEERNKQSRRAAEPLPEFMPDSLGEEDENSKVVGTRGGWTVGQAKHISQCVFRCLCCSGIFAVGERKPLLARLDHRSTSSISDIIIIMLIIIISISSYSIFNILFFPRIILPHSHQP